MDVQRHDGTSAVHPAAAAQGSGDMDRGEGSSNSNSGNDTTHAAATETNAITDAGDVPVLHTLAQQGDLAEIRKLLDSQSGDASERDHEGITALHWAAMGMHVDVCRLLLERGAEVDAVGGELMATPLHWAARNGLLSVVQLLINHGADPALTDGQGFNTLHLAVHSHNPMLLAYLLSQQLPLSIDSEDSMGQTGLQWACYQGDQISVSLLLKYGADPNRADAAGLTSVHWAAVKGSVGCIAKVVEAGGDCLKKDNNDMNPVDLARRQHSVPAWTRAMESIGREIDGRPKKTSFLLLSSDKHTKVAIFFLPLLTSFLILKTLEILPWHTGMLLSAAEAYGMHHVITRVLLDGKVNLGGTKGADALQKSPYLVAILTSSIFWVGYDWLSIVVGKTTEFAYTNFIFAAGCLLTAYNLFRCITLDPGFIAKPSSDIEVRETVDELTSEGRLNGQNFCLVCMTRQPLRSRHCRHCNRCVARFDHHCPWIWNCVGLNNHRQFMCFVAALIVSIISFDFLSYQYMSTNSPKYDPTTMSSTCLLPSPICASAHYDVRTFVITLWATVQISWTAIVLGSHLYQISKGITTLEVANLGRYGHLGSRGLSAAPQEGLIAANAAAAAANGGVGHTHGPGCKHGHGHGHAHEHTHNPLKICARLVGRMLPGTLLAIVGLDLYTKGRGAEGMVRAADKNTSVNPFDVGCINNCTDFWSRGKTLGVDYEKLYDLPQDGYPEMMRRKKREKATATPERPRGGSGYEMVRTSLEEV